jgi:hypothetical protein
MKLSNAAELINETIKRFGNIPNTKVIRYRIVKNMAKNLEACIYGRDYLVGRSVRYEGVIRLDRATVLKASKSKLISLLLHELAHSMPESIAELQKEECIKTHIIEIHGKSAMKGVHWGHGKMWKRAYRSLVKEYRAAFPGVLKAKDVKAYYN